MIKFIGWQYAVVMRGSSGRIKCGTVFCLRKKFDCGNYWILIYCLFHSFHLMVCLFVRLYDISSFLFCRNAKVTREMGLDTPRCQQVLQNISILIDIIQFNDTSILVINIKSLCINICSVICMYSCFTYRWQNLAITSVKWRNNSHQIITFSQNRIIHILTWLCAASWAWNHQQTITFRWRFWTATLDMQDMSFSSISFTKFQFSMLFVVYSLISSE